MVCAPASGRDAQPTKVITTIAAAPLSLVRRTTNPYIHTPSHRNIRWTRP